MPCVLDFLHILEGVASSPPSPPVPAVAAISTSAVAGQPPNPSGTSAVAEAHWAIVPVDNSHVFTLDYFRSYGPFTVAYRQHNAAFKYFRDVHENQADPFTSPAINFDNHAPTAVAEMDDDPRGMQWG